MSVYSEMPETQLYYRNDSLDVMGIITDVQSITLLLEYRPTNPDVKRQKLPTSQLLDN